jgi:glycosyltransferase involved in cell wall biosynthesis
MRALVTLGSRFERTPEGHYYPQSAPLNYNFFKRYLDVFDEILIVTRTLDVKAPPVGIERADGPCISILPVPLYSNKYNLVYNLVKFYPEIRSIIRRAIPSCQAYFVRIPSIIASITWREVRRLGLPFGVVMVGNPVADIKVNKNPLKLLMRYFCRRHHQAICLEACATAYVTKNSLQKFFPPRKGTFTTNYSNIDLPGSFYAAEARKFTKPATKLVFVGTLEINYKGQDYLLEAMKILKNRGFNLHLTMVGSGKLKPYLEEKSNLLGIENNVTFLGRVPSGTGVMAALNAADLFILPSFTEGLPRSMIEAMSQGLPCIGTSVGGIPELLPAADLVPPRDAGALADKIMGVTQDVGRLNQMAVQNLATAQDYKYEVLRKRRIDFFQHVKEISEQAQR